MSKTLTLTEIQQRAILGHAVQDANVLAAMQQLDVHFNENITDAVYRRLVTLAERFKAQPSREELRATLQHGDDVGLRAVLLNRVDACLEAASKVRIETIMPDLKRWGEREVFKGELQQAADVFNQSIDMFNKSGEPAGEKEHNEALSRVVDIASKLERVQVLATGARFESMAERLKGEAKERAARFDRIIPTGITYLDDASGGGIGPKDLWVVSGQTGFGKTQTLLAMAQAAGQAGKKVVFFALEAEDKELERRLKWSQLLRLFNDDNPRSNEFFDGAAWLNGEPRVCKRLERYEARADELLAERLKNVQTFYRGFGAYTDKDLERDIYTKAKDADLVIIDHLGYIDLDGKNENAAVATFMRKLYDLANHGAGRPIIIATQLRKTDNKQARKFAPLIPHMDDISGSKSIGTCATRLVMISRVSESVWHYTPETADGKKVEPTDPVRNPTLIQLQKFRAADRIRHAAVCSYNPALGSYEGEYAIGKLKSGDTVWEQANPPDWARHATLRLNDIDPQG